MVPLMGWISVEIEIVEGEIGRGRRHNYYRVSPRVTVYDVTVIESRKWIGGEKGRIPQGAVGGKEESVGGAFHDEVHRAADSVAFHVGSKGLDHLQPVEHFGGEDTHRNEAVFIIGARDLDTVDQGIVVALIHTPNNGIAAVARVIPLNRHAADPLEGIGNGDVRG